MVKMSWGKITYTCSFVQNCSLRIYWHLSAGSSVIFLDYWKLSNRSPIHLLYIDVLFNIPLNS